LKELKERTETGNQVHSIEIEKDGEYSAEQPQAFREFFINEELNTLPSNQETKKL
jgi:hypothetical protein